MAGIIYIVCPLCGMNRVLEKTGSSAIARGLTIRKVKGRIRFDHIDLTRAPIVQVRERQEGKEAQRRLTRGGGTGFVFREGLTLMQMKRKPEYADLVKQIKETALEIIKILV
jgi:hypothetical protein